jgi:hypothetical protein
MRHHIGRILIVIILMEIIGCTTNKHKDFVFEKFKEQIEKKGLKIDSVDKSGLIYINLHGTELKVSLDNAKRDFERDKDTTRIVNYVLSLDSAVIDLPPLWSEAKGYIYISLFPSDYDFTEFIHERITDDVEKIYVLSANRSLTWISKTDLKKWGVTETDLIKQANSNGDSLLAKSKITFDTIENRKIGMLETDDETLKAALLFAPSIKEKVKKDFGFPFYAVIPVRDFCYIFSDKDFNFFSKKLGATVIDEYEKSGHPITTEILKFTDNGVEAVGIYRVNNTK